MPSARPPKSNIQVLSSGRSTQAANPAVATAFNATPAATVEPTIDVAAAINAIASAVVNA